MATWFRIEFEGEPTESDFERVSELAAQGYTSGQLLNEPGAEDEEGPATGYFAGPLMHGAPAWQAAVLFTGDSRLTAFYYHEQPELDKGLAALRNDLASGVIAEVRVTSPAGEVVFDSKTITAGNSA
jgi:hypothetical protein